MKRANDGARGARNRRTADRDLVRCYLPRWTDRDPATGATVSRTSTTWWLDYRENGKRVRKSTSTSRRADAEILAGKVRERLRLRASGLYGEVEALRDLPLHRHVLAFRSMLKVRKRTGQHVRETLALLLEVLRETRVRRLDDLDPSKASTWLRDLSSVRGLAPRTVNKRVASLRAFGRFLVRTGRAPFNPYGVLEESSVDVDRRRVRRALTPDELGRLLEATAARPLAEAVARATAEAARRAAGEPAREVAAEVTADENARLRALGEARALVYRFAVDTGLRRGELGRLTWADLDLTRGEVRVRAASAKSRTEQTVPMPAHLLAAMKALRAARAEDPLAAIVFPGRVIPGPKAFRLDLAAAGLAKVLDRKRMQVDATDEEGRVVDFHGLRTTFVSSLAAAGIHPRVAQAFARHGSVELTMKAYTDPRVLDMRSACESAAARRLPAACLSSVPRGPETAPEGPTEPKEATGPESAPEAENAPQTAIVVGSRTTRPGSSTGQSIGLLIRGADLPARDVATTCDDASAPLASRLPSTPDDPLALASALLARAASMPEGDPTRAVLLEAARALLAPPAAPVAAPAPLPHLRRLGGA